MTIRFPRACAAVAMIALACSLAAAKSEAESGKPAWLAIADGPFQPTWDSLKKYECPRWFRDAKFGIWAHWSAQCVPEDGDWYARGMYEQGSGHYNYHVKNYGHPSQVGFKDICNMWHAENWDPEKLIGLYKAAGAKYFVALANHHCNFDCWDSKYQPWNSVNVGPHKDIVGTWAKAAREQGLYFGVTVHCARSWDWYDVAHGSDTTGPLAGVSYDGNLTKADGKGKWWAGLDPQDLYCRPHKPGEPPDEAYREKWYRRVRQLIDDYNPDLLYFDDGMLPLGDCGMNIAAHLYNSSIQRHNGKLEAVLNTKGMPRDLLNTLVLDIERGLSDRLEQYPWQTDTCIGEWHYRRGVHYKTAAQVVPMLVDIVSKNGNLLLNIPVRGNGTIDDEEVKFLKDMAAWMSVNSEAIFSTRPWLVYGEGAAKQRGGAFNEGAAMGHSARDIRFTYKRGTLYATALGWPTDGKYAIRSLARLPETTGEITDVQLLGHKGKLQWTHDEKGLTVTVPEKKPCEYAFVLKITGKRLLDFRPDLIAPEETSFVTPDKAGNLALNADEAEMHGAQVQIEQRGDQANIGFWDKAGDWVSWKVKLDQPGTFAVSADCAGAAGDTEFAVEVDGQTVRGQAIATKTWDDYVTVKLGDLEIRTPGLHTVTVRPANPGAWLPMNLKTVKLTKVGGR